MPRPRGGEWLDDDIRFLSFQHTDMLVSLLTDSECVALNLMDEEASCHQHGMIYVSFPILDRQVPSLTMATMTVIRQIATSLMQGKHIAIHCRMGIGRSAMIAASALALTGVAPAHAFEAITTARKCPVPDTAEQRAWVDEFLAFSKQFALTE